MYVCKLDDPLPSGNFIMYCADTLGVTLSTCSLKYGGYLYMYIQYTVLDRCF